MRTAGERLAGLLPCPECRLPLGAIACGPAHAALKADPTQHRLVMDALAEALRESDAAPVARPRVVWLDPDNHDQMALLNIRFRRGKSRSDVENMQAALREFLADETREGAQWECGPHTNAWGGHDARCRQVPAAQSPSGGDA